MAYFRKIAGGMRRRCSETRWAHVRALVRSPPYSLCVDDLQRQPKDDDRDALIARINRAHAEGRIGQADRDIRLANVGSAQSMAELDLMSRELDQLDAVVPSGPAASPEPASVAPYGTFKPKRSSDFGAQAVSVSGRALAVAFAVVLVIALVVAGAVYVVARDTQSGNGSAEDPAVAPNPEPEVPVSPGEEETDVATPAPAGTKYSLTGDGIRGFLQTYQKKFGTTRVVDLTLYGGYVIVNVPVPGKARQSGWLFRDQQWTPFGGVRAVFPGAQPIDTKQLVIPALMRNIKRARATLNVEKPAQTYVIVRFIQRSEEVPSVDIHVANDFNESGYLATTLDGRVERAYPYAA